LYEKYNSGWDDDLSTRNRSNSLRSKRVDPYLAGVEENMKKANLT
jgi:hypothetical protein